MKLNTSKIIIFMLFCIFFSILLIFYSNEFIISKNIFYNSYSEQLTLEQIQRWLDFRHKWIWLIYVSIPLIYLFKILLITSCLYTGFFFYQDDKVRFGEIMGNVVIADMVFLAPLLIKVFWFSFGNTNFTLEDFQYFSPLSLLNIFDIKLVEKWLIYPLQAFNVFEVVFWFILGYQLKPLLKNDFTKSFKLVLASYGSGFMVWIILVVFLTLNVI